MMHLDGMIIISEMGMQPRALPRASLALWPPLLRGHILPRPKIPRPKVPEEGCDIHNYIYIYIYIFVTSAHIADLW